MALPTSPEAELIYQAHNALHNGDVSNAHELLHKACGIDNDALEYAPLSHLRQFEQAFATACRKNGIRAAFVVAEPADQTGRSRLIVGGNAEIAQALRRLSEEA